MLLFLWVAGPRFVEAQIGGGIANRFEIDGNLIANNPGVTFDWLDGTVPCAAGGSGGVLSNAAPGNAKFPFAAPFAFVDHTLDNADRNDPVFQSKSNKVSDDPNAYSWSTGSAPQKDDIGNGAFAFSFDSSNNLWVAVSGDRESVNGESYIDFELLQRRLTRNPDGTFTSLGPDGGRTKGDMILTIHLRRGGSAPEFFAQIWTNVPPSSAFPSGFAYVDAVLPPGTAFVAANSNFVANVCYGAFGATTYPPNAFGEAAANLTALLPSIKIDACFAISTVFMRTKSSASPTSELKDFIEPIRVGVCADNIPPSLVSCPPDKVIECPAALVFGTPVFTDNCTATNEIVISFQDTELTATCPEVRKVRRTFTATDNCGNMSQCSQTIGVRDTTPPVVVAAAPNGTVVCPTPATFTTPTFSDSCGMGVNVSVAQEFLSVTCPEVQKVRRTWTAVDRCGNSVSTNQTITSISQCTPPPPQPPFP